MADNGGKGILSGGTELLVEGRYEDHCLGDAVSFHGERFIITGKESRLAGGLWVHDYALRREGLQRAAREGGHPVPVLLHHA